MEIDSVADFWETLKKSPHFNRSRDPRSGRPGREFLAIRSENGTESASDLVYPSEILYFAVASDAMADILPTPKVKKTFF